MLDDAVATQDTVTQLIAMIRKVRREVPGAAEVMRRCALRMTTTTRANRRSPGTTARPARCWSRPGQRRPGVLAVLAGWELDGPAAEAVALLALIAGQDVEPAEGSDGTDGRWRIGRGWPTTG